jgi:hypothetical protein
MAEIPQGPGQAEMTGKDKHEPQEVGMYRDPQSGKQLHVVHPAAADALVRAGWELVKSGKRIPADYVLDTKPQSVLDENGDPVLNEDGSPKMEIPEHSRIAKVKETKKD